jgi:hypothetical protein
MPEIAAEPILEAAGAAGGAEGGAGGLGSMLKDFNDIPGAKILGSVAGKVVKSAAGAIGTGKDPVETVDEGPVGRLA